MNEQATGGPEEDLLSSFVVGTCTLYDYVML